MKKSEWHKKMYSFIYLKVVKDINIGSIPDYITALELLTKIAKEIPRDTVECKSVYEDFLNLIKSFETLDSP